MPNLRALSAELSNPPDDQQDHRNHQEEVEQRSSNESRDARDDPDDDEQDRNRHEPVQVLHSTSSFRSRKPRSGEVMIRAGPGMWSVSVLRDRRVDFLGPRSDPAFQVADLPVALLPEELRRATAPRSGPAVDDDMPFGLDLLVPLRQLPERDQPRSLGTEIPDLPLVRLPNVDQRDPLASIEQLLQLGSGKVRRIVRHSLQASSIGFNTAEQLVIDQLGHRRIVPAHGALRVP